MADKRAKENIQPEDIVVLAPGESAPPTLVVLPDGRVITFQEFEQMELENEYNGDDE